MGKIIEKHKLFADTFLSSSKPTVGERIAEAEKAAGYKSGGGARLLRMKDIMEYIDRQRQGIQAMGSGKSAGDTDDIVELAGTIIAGLELDDDGTLTGHLEEKLREALSDDGVGCEAQREEIADPDDVAVFLTAVMNAGGPERFAMADLKEQMKAAEFLAKYHGMFSKEKVSSELTHQQLEILGDDQLEP